MSQLGTITAPISVATNEPRPARVLDPPSTTAVTLRSVRSMPVTGEPMADLRSQQERGNSGEGNRTRQRRTARPAHS